LNLQGIPHRYRNWFIGWCALTAIPILRDTTLLRAAEGSARVLTTFILIGLAISALQTPTSRYRFLAAMTAVMTGFTATNLGLFAAGRMPTVFIDNYTRWEGPTTSFVANAFGAAFAVVLNGFWILTAEQRRSQVFHAVCAVGGLVVLANTYNRGPMVGLAVLLVVVLLWRRNYVPLVGAIALMVLAWSASETIRERFDDFAMAVESDDERVRMAQGSGRIWIWTQTWNTYTNGTLFQRLFGFGFDRQMTATGVIVDSHNEYLSMLFQYGPFALLWHAFFTVATMWTSGELARRATTEFDRVLGQFGLGIGMMAIATNLLSNAWISRPTQAWMWGMFMGTVYAAYLALPKESPRTAAPVRRSMIDSHLSPMVPSTVSRS
jgi:hypothetical protein